MKKKFLLPFFILTLYLFKLEAQNEPQIIWAKCFGGSDAEEAMSLRETSDGGFIVAGYSNSLDGDITGNHGGYDFWIVKLDGAGNMQWEKSLGGSSDDAAFSIQQTSDGGFIVAGKTSSNDGDVSGNHGSSDCWLVKLDALGDIDWQKCLGGANILGDVAYSVQQTTDGGFILAGAVGSNNGDVSGNHGTYDYWIVKLDTVGNIEWQKCLGGSDYDVPFSIQQTTDNGFIVAGYSYSDDGDLSINNGYNDYWILKLNGFGSIEWQKSLGGSLYDAAFFVQQTTDEGFVVAGYSGSDCWIIKLDVTGYIQWEKLLGGSGADVAYFIQETFDGGFIFTGYSTSNEGDVSGNHGNSDIWLVKLGAPGNVEWQKSLGGSWGEKGSSVQQTVDGGYIVAGLSASDNGNVSGNHGGQYDFWVVKLICTDSTIFYADTDGDGYGNANATLLFPGCVAPIGYVFDNSDCDDSTATINPYAFEIFNNSIDENCSGMDDDIYNGINNLTATTSSFTLYPNPSSEFITLELQLKGNVTFNGAITITDLLGRIAFEKQSQCIGGTLKEVIPINEKFSQGLYFVRVSSEEKQWVKTFIVQ